MSGVRKRALFCCELYGWRGAPGEIGYSLAAPKEQNLTVGQHLQLEMDKITLSTPPLAPTGPHWPSTFRCLLIQNPPHSPKAMQVRYRACGASCKMKLWGPGPKSRRNLKGKLLKYKSFPTLPWSGFLALSLSWPVMVFLSDTIMLHQPGECRLSQTPRVPP